MSTSKPRLYWDTCIFLAWLHDENVHPPGLMEGIEEMAREIHNEGLDEISAVCIMLRLTTR